ncbi:MAG TPA: c-type cytochrome [Alphaproteobacteria bacterium]|nr:c-type cytochrome [Alphaproteobacteria bacterium]
MRNLVFFAATAASITLAGAAAGAADAVHGEEIYNSRCIACHSPDANRVGPMHRGVFGRVAGTVPGFAYSKALKGAGITWDETTLDRWLTDPQAFLPGQRMNFRVSDPADRADLVAYLKTLK